MTLPRRVALLLVAFCLLAAPASAPAAGEYAQALRLEQQGDLPGALGMLAPLELSDAQAAHRDALGAAVHAIGAAETYRDLDQLDVAQSVLQSAVQQLDPIRDVYVYAILNDQLDDVATQIAAADDDSGLGGVIDDARDELGSAATTLFGWAVAIGALLVVGGLLVLVGRAVRSRIPPKDGICVALEDLTADADDHADADRGLGQEVLGAVRALGQSGTDEPHPELDVARDLDGNPSLNVRVSGDTLVALDRYVKDDTPLTVGPVSLSPRQLLAFLAANFARRYQFELRGHLTASDQTSRVVLDLLCNRTKRPVRWSCSAQGDNARARLVDGVARRVVFETAPNHASHRWPSVESYQKARLLLADLDDTPATAPAASDEQSAASNGGAPDDPASRRVATLEEARGLLERALAADAANYAARFELGNVLRRLGRNRDAARQYDLLKRLPAPRPAPTRSGRFAGYVGAPAQFVHSLGRDRDAARLAEPPAPPPALHAVPLRVLRGADYARAVALSKIDCWETHHDALKLLETVQQDVTDDSDYSDQEKENRLLVIRSARAATLVFEAERFHDEHGRGDTAERLAELRERVDAECTWVRKAVERVEGIDATAFAQACAVVDNASGRMAYLAGERREPILAFESALTLAPEFGDAHVNLAAALLRGSTDSLDLEQRIERHLDRALQTSPHDAKAMWLYAKLYRRQGNEDERRAVLERAAALGDDRAIFELANDAWKAKRFTDALVGARRSLTLRPEPDYRAKLFIGWVASDDVLPTLGGMDDPTLAAADDAADALEKDARKRKKPLSAELVAAIEAVRRQRAAPPPTPAGVAVAADTDHDAADDGDGGRSGA